MTTLTASDIAARRIREARNRRGWTVKDLAAACDKAGAPGITAAVITNLETRRRPGREITADELLSLAWVLGVPPLQLLSPMTDDEELQVVPGQDKAPLDAVAWLTDDDAALAPVWKARNPRIEGAPELRAGSSPLTVLRQIRAAGRTLRYHDRALTDEKFRVRYTPETETEHRNMVALLGWRILGFLSAMEMLGYPRMKPEELEILERRGVGAGPDEWEGDADGAGS